MTLYKPRRKDRRGVLRPCAIWWADFVVAGTRYRRSLGVKDRHAAQVREAEIIRKLEPRFGLDLIVKSQAEIATRLQQKDSFLAEILRNGRVIYEAAD